MKKGYLLVFLTAVISGFSIFINRFGVSVVNPYMFAFLKNASVAVFLLSILLLFKDWKLLKKINRKQWALLILIGLIGGSIPFLLFFKGLSLTTAASGSFLHKTIFIYVALLAFVFLKEKIDRKFLIGAGLLILGNVFLLKTVPVKIGMGELFVLLAALFWAVESIISKYVLKELSSRIVACSRMFFGSIFIFLFLLLSNQAVLLVDITLKQIGWVSITAILLFAYVMTWYSGLKYIPVSKATVILLLGSPITSLLSLVWTGQITINNILAGLSIILGIIIIFGLTKTYQTFKSFKKLIHVRT